MRPSIILALSAALLASSPVLGVQGGKHERRRHERAIKGERSLAAAEPKTIELTTGGAPVVVDDVRIEVSQEKRRDESGLRGPLICQTDKTTCSKDTYRMEALYTDVHYHLIRRVCVG